MQAYVSDNTTTTTTTNNNSSSSSSSSIMASSPEKKRPKGTDLSLFVVDVDGEKWRKCAGAAVLNSDDHILVGQRRIVVQQDESNGTDEPTTKTVSTWQCPQGGVKKKTNGQKGRVVGEQHDDDDDDDDEKELMAAQVAAQEEEESIAEASSRELYKEMGLKVDTHVMIVGNNNGKNNTKRKQLAKTATTTLLSPVTPVAVRYRTPTSSWLSKAGFAGQELHWAIFRCTDARGDADPTLMCKLFQSCSNNNNPDGEAEFSNVAWQPIGTVVDHAWQAKRQAYAALQKTLENVVLPQWQEQVQTLDFSGTWLRDWMDCAQALMRRGLSYEQAITEAEKPYVQKWERGSLAEQSWVVTTYNVDGVTPRRTLEYKKGEWDEYYSGQSTLFGTSSSGGATLKRRTCYVAEPEAEPLPVAHATVTLGPKGIEEARRYLKAGQMMVRRTLWSNETPDEPVVSTEIFLRSTMTRD